MFDSHCVGFSVLLPYGIWPRAQIAVATRSVGIGVRMVTVFNKFDYSYVLLFFLDIQMSIFGKSIGSLVNILWLIVNLSSISWVHLTWSRTSLEATEAIVVDILVSQILILKGKLQFTGIDSSLFACFLLYNFSCT